MHLAALPIRRVVNSSMLSASPPSAAGPTPAPIAPSTASATPPSRPFRLLLSASTVCFIFPPPFFSHFFSSLPRLPWSRPCPLQILRSAAAVHSYRMVSLVTACTISLTITCSRLTLLQLAHRAGSLLTAGLGFPLPTDARTLHTRLLHSSVLSSSPCRFVRLPKVLCTLPPMSCCSLSLVEVSSSFPSPPSSSFRCSVSFCTLSQMAFRDLALAVLFTI